VDARLANYDLGWRIHERGRDDERTTATPSYPDPTGVFNIGRSGNIVGRGPPAESRRWTWTFATASINRWRRISFPRRRRCSKLLGLTGVTMGSIFSSRTFRTHFTILTTTNLSLPINSWSQAGRRRKVRRDVPVHGYQRDGQDAWVLPRSVAVSVGEVEVI